MSIQPAVRDAIGESRCQALLELDARTRAVEELVADASTIEMWTMWMPPNTAEKWKRSISAGESWVYATRSDGRLMALDGATSDGMHHEWEALTFPPLHSHLVAWWLTHAWRGSDLVRDTIGNLRAWRLPSAAVTGRAVLEEAGCLVYESRRLADAWQQAKLTPGTPNERAIATFDAMNKPLIRAGLGSRLQVAPETLKATSVLTYVQKLGKATGDGRFETWYDWLSDAAHPAFGARIAFSPRPMAHDSGAVLVRFHSRSPVPDTYSRTATRAGSGDDPPLENQIAEFVVDSLLTAGTVIASVLEQMLTVVDDFGLTTEAATLNSRRVWRGFSPVRGSKRCPCGRGKWAACGHRWGEPAPMLVVPRTGR